MLSLRVPRKYNCLAWPYLTGCCMGADGRKFPPTSIFAGWCVSLYETGSLQRSWDAEVLVDGQPWPAWANVQEFEEHFMHKDGKI